MNIKHIKNAFGFAFAAIFFVGCTDVESINDVDLNQTINSWLCKEFGRIPTSGDNFIFKDEWKIRVKSATRKGAREVEFSRVE